MTSLKMQNKIIDDLQEEINILQSSIPDEMINILKTHDFLSEEVNTVLQEAEHYEPISEKFGCHSRVIILISQLCLQMSNSFESKGWETIREIDEKKRIICEIKKTSDIRSEDMEIILKLRNKYYEENCS